MCRLEASLNIVLKWLINCQFFLACNSYRFSISSVDLMPSYDSSRCK